MKSDKRSKNKPWAEEAEHTLAPFVEPLNDEERAWVAEFAAVMEKMPDRLLVFECGSAVSIVDKAAAREADLEDGGARASGIILACVISATCSIVSAAG